MDHGHVAVIAAIGVVVAAALLGAAKPAAQASHAFLSGGIDAPEAAMQGVIALGASVTLVLWRYQKMVVEEVPRPAKRGHA